MGWQELLGQGPVRRILAAEVTEGRVHHAYLFLGPDARGKEEAARILAQALNCETGAHDPCGVCRNCRLIAAGTHPDVRILVPSGRFIRLEEVRELCRSVPTSPLAGVVKCYVLHEADRLLPEAANHLLKVLEDPPAATVFVLIARRAYALLPTIVSRCQVVNFQPLPLHEAVRRLKDQGCEPEWAHLVAHITGGDLEEAVGWLTPQVRHLRQEFLVLAPELPLGKGVVFRAAAVLATDAPRALRLLSAWYRDLIVWRAGLDLLYNEDAKGLVAEVSQLYTTRDLLHAQWSIGRAERLIMGRTNVNVRLALEALLVELRAKRPA
ncbi:MAG: DNA polymerase III subunit delta' [bacterium]|jgi:DNA polymerase-3 subunit delta'